MLLFDGQIVELANSDWTALAEAVRMVVPSASEGGKAKVAKARKPKQSAANQGSRWTPEEDKKLLHLWQEDGVTIEDLMQCFGRNGGGITGSTHDATAMHSLEAICAKLLNSPIISE
ncbi:SANT/Myb-like DNA-binding domain-containing protein [Sphingobium baderi]|uniref:hypothetical protein n=1 Tax=Sphingobium baderi TaxID=1332080 RepID=UPI002B40A4CE|nr:hypothetical protein [Sphingobium baderi]